MLGTSRSLKMGKDPYLKFQREKRPAQTLILDFQPPEVRNNELLLHEAAQFVVQCLVYVARETKGRVWSWEV